MCKVVAVEMIGVPSRAQAHVSVRVCARVVSLHGPYSLSNEPSSQQKNFNSSSKTSAFGMVFLNAVIAGPITAVLALAFGELKYMAEFPHLSSASFWAAFLIVSCALR
jgi:hypothetical protein